MHLRMPRFTLDENPMWPPCFFKVSPRLSTTLNCGSLRTFPFWKRFAKLKFFRYIFWKRLPQKMKFLCEHLKQSVTPFQLMYWRNFSVFYFQTVSPQHCCTSVWHAPSEFITDRLVNFRPFTYNVVFKRINRLRLATISVNRTRK